MRISPRRITFLPGAVQNSSAGTSRVPSGPSEHAPGLERDQRCDRVARRRRVAEITPDARPALDLPSAHDPRRVDQRRIGGRDLGVLVDAVTRDGRPEPQALPRLVGQLHQLRDSLDVDDQVRVPQVLPHLDQEVRPSRQDPGRPVGPGQQGRRLGQRGRGRVIKIFHDEIPC